MAAGDGGLRTGRLIIAPRLLAPSIIALSILLHSLSLVASCEQFDATPVGVFWNRSTTMSDNNRSDVDALVNYLQPVRDLAKNWDIDITSW